jgi:hypothetical protein
MSSVRSSTRSAVTTILGLLCPAMECTLYPVKVHQTSPACFDQDCVLGYGEQDYVAGRPATPIYLHNVR